MCNLDPGSYSTPLLHSKTGVYKGILFFFFALKHRFWVLAEAVLSNMYPQPTF